MPKLDAMDFINLNLIKIQSPGWSLMHEKREFFRLKNTGNIHGIYGSHELDIVEISSSGIAVIKKNIHIQKEGMIDLKINHVAIKVHYELLRIELRTMVLVFKNKEEIDCLFPILQRMKNENRLQ